MSTGRIPPTIEVQSQNLSRIAGSVWRSLSQKEKAPWYARAAEEKRKHEERFPGYEYRPRDSWDARRGRRVVKKGRGEEELQTAKRWCGEVAGLVKGGKEGPELEKAFVEIPRSKMPMMEDEFEVIESVRYGSVSTRTSSSSPLDDVPIDIPSIASLLAPSSPSFPPTHTCEPPPVLPSMSIPLVSHSAPRLTANINTVPIFPGALHVPDKPLLNTSRSAPSLQSVLPSKIRSYGASSSSLQIPAPFSGRENHTYDPPRWALRPSRPNVVARHLRRSSDSDLEGEGDSVYEESD